MAVPKVWRVFTMVARTAVRTAEPMAGQVAWAVTPARTAVRTVVPMVGQVAWAVTAVQTAGPVAEPAAWAPRAAQPEDSVVMVAPMAALTAAQVATRPPVKGPR